MNHDKTPGFLPSTLAPEGKPVKFTCVWNFNPSGGGEACRPVRRAGGLPALTVQGLTLLRIFAACLSWVIRKVRKSLGEVWQKPPKNSPKGSPLQAEHRQPYPVKRSEGHHQKSLFQIGRKVVVSLYYICVK
ncbi:hypothetical protein DC20_21830 (plasmid) [Rufibacter tibetensis]|uniref:Uncharacterized protein n=1 Tax=Rufibacter tibetensis TaxID=512763 RepID=A0A0P0CPN7_9BACT|nr:hypothetical protein DC20_21830 [Rufibacter tibetensis]